MKKGQFFILCSLFVYYTFWQLYFAVVSCLVSGSCGVDDLKRSVVGGELSKWGFPFSFFSSFFFEGVSWSFLFFFFFDGGFLGRGLDDLERSVVEGELSRWGNFVNFLSLSSSNPFHISNEERLNFSQKKGQFFQQSLTLTF